LDSELKVSILAPISNPKLANETNN
jgi:hypothetical protein